MQQQRSAPRQLVIGLDAAEWTLVSRWAAEGKLPAFRALLDGGVHGRLATTAGQLPDTVWSCIYGGTNPGTFEKHFYVQYDARTGDLRHVRDDAFTDRPFWDVLSEAGRTVGVLDAVKFTTSKRLRGFQLTNWGAHATKATKSSVPADLVGEVERRFGRHPVGDCDAVDDNPQSQLDLRRRVLDGVRLRGRVYRALLAERPWDVLFACFSEPHCIGHHFWHWLDPDHPRHGEADTHGLADSIEAVYRAIDEEIGALVELAGDDAHVMIVAGHGMGPLHHASWNIGEMLDLLGYGRGPARQAAPAATAGTNFWRILKMTLPGRLQYFIKNLLPQSLQDELLFRWYAGKRDWKGRRAFPVPNNDAVGAIRVNVVGRDKHGIVPAAEYGRVLDDLVAAFEELTDPASGRTVVKDIVRCHEVFHGPFTGGLPDLTILWESAFPWHAVRSPRFGTLTLKNQDGRSGSHTPIGFVILRGPGIPAGQVLEGHSIHDVAPTILALAGVELPAHMEGHPIPVSEGTVSV